MYKHYKTKYKEGKYTILILDGGQKQWYYKRKLHREDGPAFEYQIINNEYWLDGHYYTKEDYIIEMRRRKFKELNL